MNQARWKKIEEIFHAACEIPAERRAAFLDSHCGGDRELKNEVESLIYYSEQDDVLSDNQHLYLGLNLICKEKAQSLAGQKFGRYEIIKLLGQGGMGAVYQATDSVLNRPVALKLLPEFMIESDENVERFKREALAASAISHPNIAHIYEAGFENNRQFIAMELIEGITLRELLREKKVDLITALDIVLQTAGALASAHQAGIVHRDIKPENIMIRPDGYVKVLDFGIAKLSEPTTPVQKERRKPDKKRNPRVVRDLQSTRTGLILGTLGYISLEQLSGKNVDLRTDIWSLGVVLYEALTGSKPFKGKTVNDIRSEILRTGAPPISFPKLYPNDEAQLQGILAKMLNPDRDKRYQSAGDLVVELKKLKRSLEFSRQLYPTENTGDAGGAETAFDTLKQTQDSGFINKSKQLWAEPQSLSRKAVGFIFVLALITLAASAFVQYFSRFSQGELPEAGTFSPDSRSRLQISTLFGVRKKLQSSIPFISFSPDGRSIAFVLSGNGTNDIFIKHLDQNEPVRITDGKWVYQTPVWSPDKKQLAFVSNRENTNAIWTISSEGGIPVLRAKLEINFVSCQLLKWSNDEKRVFFQSGKTLKTLELDSGRIEEIKFPVENVGTVFNISADESLAAFVGVSGENTKLWVYNFRNKELSEAANEPNLNISPVIMPDNKRIVYSSNRNGNSQLYLENFIDKTSTQITFGDANAYQPVVSPDGRRIVYVSENNLANIFSMELSSGKESRLTEATKMQLFPALSKDRINLVFQLTEEYANFTQSPLKLKNLETGEERALEGQTGFWAKWSPAGNEIAYLRHQESGFNIWKTGLSDSRTQPLTNGGVLSGGYATAPFNMLAIPFDWSPDGQKIVFISKQSGSENVWIVDNDGTNQKMLTGSTDPKTGYNSAVWSPDGDKIGFARRIQTEPNKFRYDISIFSNNRIKELFQSDRKMRLLGWSENGGGLLAAVDNLTETEIYAFSETAAPKLLTKLMGADFPGISLSEDGRTIAFSAVRNGIYNIYSYSINGKEKQLTDNKEDTILFSGISWSPAGDRLFYSKQSGGIQISMISDNSE